MWGFSSQDIGIDLGTANTLVYVRGRGIVLQEPSVVAVKLETKQPVAVGAAAKRMIGRTPGNIVAIRPMKDGAISDFDITQIMLRHFINKANRQWSPLRPRLVVCVPSGVTEVEKRAVKEAGRQAGVREAYTIEEPMAAAIGAELPVNEPTGSMVVDIGGGTTEVAVISLGGVVNSRSIRIAGDEMDGAIVDHVKHHYNLAIGERMAEDVKIAIGSACPVNDDASVEIRGRDLVTGLPKRLRLTGADVRQALQAPVRAIVDAVRFALEYSPPELAADIMDRGIVLTGGGALLKGLDESITHETGMPVMVSDEPLLCVVKGIGRVVEELRELQGILH